MPASSDKLGLRTVAFFEAAKGALVLLLGFGLLTLGHHRDLDELAARLTEWLHLGAHRRLANLFYHLADHLEDFGLWKLVAVAIAYATIRFVEAVGLWKERAWAEWFALISGCIYLPLEVYEIVHRPRPLKWAVLLANLLIMIYMARLRLKAAPARA